jgi:hypothetical protein
MSEEERNVTIREIRVENRKRAELIMKGTRYHEPVEVKGIDKQTHTFDVFPMSDGDLAELLDSTGVDLRDIGDKEKLAKNLKFMQKGAALATGVPDISRVLWPLESLKLIMKSFELNELTGTPKPA